jgi:uncharacterized phiE125 gp8 family phage protein
MLTTVTARDSDLPVSLDEAKQHCRVLNGDYDTLIQSLIEAATDYCETVTGRALRKYHTVKQTFDKWPCSPFQFDRQPVLENQPGVIPTTAATVVQYYDADGVLQTVDDANYRLQFSSEAAARLEFDDAFVEPTYYEREDAIVITYMAGYADIESVPARAKTAILWKTELLFCNLEEWKFAALEKAIANELASLDWGCYR